MSPAAARATTRPVPRPARPAAKPAASRASYLRLVTARRSHAARAPFVAVVVSILGVGLLGLLLLNTVLAQDAFRLHALQLQGRVLADQEQALQRDVERLQSPASLAQRATALGMVPGGPPAFLRLSDGKVLGSAVPGAAPLVPLPAAVQPVAARVAGAGKTAATTAKTSAKKVPARPAGSTWVLVSPAQPKKATTKAAAR